MITLFYLIFLHFAGCYATSCGTQDDSVPQLSVTVADVKNAGTDVANKIFTRVLYRTSEFEAQWSDWQNLNTVGCDDLDRGQTDYFDLDLNGSTSLWMAIAFYASTTDGLLIESFTYWNGSAPVDVETFCGRIMGPSRGDACFEDEDDDDTLCYNDFTSDPTYGSFWIDSPACVAVSINLGEENALNNAPGTAFAVSDPGTPTNPTSAFVSVRLDKDIDGMAPILSSYGHVTGANLIQLIIIGAVSLAVISFMCGYYYFKKKNKDAVYKPLLV